jgi:hypothetical protein
MGGRARDGRGAGEASACRSARSLLSDQQAGHVLPSGRHGRRLSHRAQVKSRAAPRDMSPTGQPASQQPTRDRERLVSSHAQKEQPRTWRSTRSLLVHGSDTFGATKCACSVCPKPVPSKHSVCRSPTVGGVDDRRRVAIALERSGKPRRRPPRLPQRRRSRCLARETRAPPVRQTVKMRSGVWPGV